MASHIYDAIVIGAGGMGSAAAYKLAMSGSDVLVVEKFHRGHTFGSSHGETRIIRFFYDKPYYTELMKTAYAEWRDLESKSGKQLLFITGSVCLGQRNNQYVSDVQNSLDAGAVEYESWDDAQLVNRFPQFNVSNNMDILWQKDTGFLYASECVSSYLKLAEHHGADIRENTTVTNIDWQLEIPTVYTENNKYSGRKVIVTAGAWTSNLLNELNLPLNVTKQQVCYYKPTDYIQFQPDTFPVFTEITIDGMFMYGMPYFGANGAKVARHGMGKSVSPDTCNRTPEKNYINLLDTYVRNRIPELGKAVHSEMCLYTETPDEDFIIDKHPDCPNILIAAGFSGHGFKFCSLVGRIMSELALTGKTELDISPFHIDRLNSL